MAVNIGKDKKDSSYRYKMPRLQAKVEGRGNGIKTVVLNMQDIAKSLHCPPEYPTKFFGIELGAQSKYDRKLDRAIVNGNHGTGDLASHLEKFIDIFILCPQCQLPEIKMSVRKDIKIDCAACGYNGLLKTAHKLVTYITKNPPKSLGKKGSSSSKKERKSKKKSKRSQADEAAADDDAQPEQVADDVAKAPKKDKKEEEVEWFTDTSKEAMLKRKEKELEEMKQNKSAEQVLMGNVQDLTSETPEMVLKLFLADRERKPHEVVSELKRLQLARGLDDSKRFSVFVHAIVDAKVPKSIPATFKKHAGAFAILTKERGQTASLIGAIIECLGKTYPKLLVLLPHCLKALYEQDALSEEAIISWSESPTETDWQVPPEVAADARKKASALVEWLKNAEEESSSDEDDE